MVDEQKFEATLKTILAVYAGKKVRLEKISVDHTQGIVVLRLLDKIRCPKCVRSAIKAKLKYRFPHIKNVEVRR